MTKAPRYASTRDASRCEVPFRQALLNALAPDGGLYVPTRIPRLPASRLPSATFADLAVEVLGEWLAGEFPGEVLEAVARQALDFRVPLVRLEDELFVLELFHGPTLSFKDFGARVMARLLNHCLEEMGERITILVATSGDTGSAVAAGFAGLEHVRVVLLYPEGRVSEVQERQLIVDRPGVQPFRVAGDFDACQRLLKEAFRDPALKSLRLSTANSINVGRLLPQTLYYLWAVQGATGGGERTAMAQPTFVVPSGNLGNLTAGLLARAMCGADWHLVAAHNANDFFPDYLTGREEAYRFRTTVATLSNAMDVGAPSNFERLNAMFEDELATAVWGTSVDDAATRSRMRSVFGAKGYVACPHTAVGLEAATRFSAGARVGGPVVTLATAHPAKFPDVVAEVLGTSAPRSERLESLRHAETRVRTIRPDLAELREHLLGC